MAAYKPPSFQNAIARSAMYTARYSAEYCVAIFARPAWDSGITTRGSASFLWPLGVAGPLAPRAGVELAAFQAGHFHREQVVAGGDA
jgi:hypothetical protein